MIQVDSKSGIVSCENESELRAVAGVMGFLSNGHGGTATADKPRKPKATGKPGPKGPRSAAHTAAIKKAQRAIRKLAKQEGITYAEAARLRKENMPSKPRRTAK